MKGCLMAALVLVAVVSLIGLGAFKLFQNFTSAVDDFPEYAKKETVYRQYGTFIGKVQAAIDESQTMHDLAARLEKVELPDELLYLTLIKEASNSFDQDKLEIVERVEVSSSAYTLINGSGHGTINDMPVIVIQLPVDRHSIEECLIYLRYNPSRKAPEPELEEAPAPVLAGSIV